MSTSLDDMFKSAEQYLEREQAIAAAAAAPKIPNRLAKLGAHPPGSMGPIKRDLSERYRVKDMRHVEILEDIAQNSTNEGYRLTAIIPRSSARFWRNSKLSSPARTARFTMQLTAYRSPRSLPMLAYPQAISAC
jgi:hypothetical protein